MQKPGLQPILLVALMLRVSSAHTYVSWFRPDRGFARWRESSLNLWGARLTAPIGAAVLLAVLISMLLCQFGLCR